MSWNILEFAKWQDYDKMIKINDKLGSWKILDFEQTTNS